MVSNATEPDRSHSTVLASWSARKVRPIVVLYVVAVFAAFILLSVVVFHSQEAVKALAMAAVAAVAATVPGVLEKVEYRMTGSGIEKRPVKKNQLTEFKEVFLWDELHHIVMMRHGFKYSKKMVETNPLRRFWKANFSAEFSGEVHVEKQDLERIVGIVERHM